MRPMYLSMEREFKRSVTVNSIADTCRIAGQVARRSFPGLVIPLLGDLGAGKTAFVTGFCAALGIAAQVSSPTYTLINEYPGRLPVYHMDLYRLTDGESLWDIGFEDYLAGRGIALIEWPQIAWDWLPEERLDVELIHQGETGRIISLTGHGQRCADLVRELEI